MTTEPIFEPDAGILAALVDAALDEALSLQRLPQDKYDPPLKDAIHDLALASYLLRRQTSKTDLDAAEQRGEALTRASAYLDYKAAVLGLSAESMHILAGSDPQRASAPVEAAPPRAQEINTLRTGITLAYEAARELLKDEDEAERDDWRILETLAGADGALENTA